MKFSQLQSGDIFTLRGLDSIWEKVYQNKPKNFNAKEIHPLINKPFEDWIYPDTEINFIGKKKLKKAF